MSQDSKRHIVAAASFWQKGRGAGPGARTHRRGTITQPLGDPKQAEEPPSAARRGAEKQGRWRPQEIQARRVEPHFLCVRKHPEVTWMLRTEVKCVGRPTRGWNDDRKRRKKQGSSGKQGYTSARGAPTPDTPCGGCGLDPPQLHAGAGGARRESAPVSQFLEEDLTELGDGSRPPSGAQGPEGERGNAAS